MAFRSALSVRVSSQPKNVKVNKVNFAPKNISKIAKMNTFAFAKIPLMKQTTRITLKTIVPRFSAISTPVSSFSSVSIKSSIPKSKISLSVSPIMKLFNKTENVQIRRYAEESSQQERRPLTQEEREEKQKRSIFVGGLSPSTRGGEVRNFFNQFGTVTSVRFLWVDKDIRTHRGNCFVEFSNEGEASAACEASNGKDFNGNTIRVNMAGAKPTRTPNPNYKQADPAVSVFIGNLPFETVDDDLRQAFSNCGEIVSISIPKNTITGKAKGFAIISFTSEVAKENALSCSGNELNGRPITVQNLVKRDPSQRRPRREGGDRRQNQEQDQ